MLSIHPNARTTLAVRAEIARSPEPTSVLARRYGVSTETVRKWRRRGAEDCLDHSARPHKLPWKAAEDERRLVCDLRRFTALPLDELSFVVRHFLPHLNRGSIYRILRAEGLGRLPPRPRPGKPKGQGRFKDYDLGFVHIDVKHLPKLETADGFEAACRALGVEHRMTRPYTPQTNGMVERFNRRIQDEVLCITIHSHAALEHLLQGFGPAYNARRQRVLKGQAPNHVVTELLKARPELANPRFRPPNPCSITRGRIDALRTVEHAKEASQPNTPAPSRSSCRASSRTRRRCST